MEKMNRYYGVTRDLSYLVHLNAAGSGGGSLTKSNNKYIARILQSNGKYRYFYSSDELVAYKKKQISNTSDTRSLREKWEERRGLLSESKSTSGSGSKSGRGSVTKGRSRGSSGKVTEKHPQVTALYSGSLKQERAHEYNPQQEQLADLINRLKWERLFAKSRRAR